jgi:hypothetical protein
VGLGSLWRVADPRRSSLRAGRRRKIEESSVRLEREHRSSRARVRVSRVQGDRDHSKEVSSRDLRVKVRVEDRVRGVEGVVPGVVSKARTGSESPFSPFPSPLLPNPTDNNK